MFVILNILMYEELNVRMNWLTNNHHIGLKVIHLINLNLIFVRRFNSSHAFKMKLYQESTRLKCTFIFFCLTSLHFEKMYLSHIFHYQ